MKSFDIMYCGHVCLDICPQFPAQKRELSDIFRPGKLITVNNAKISLGGSVSNSGAAAAKLGLRTLINTRVGDDDFGKTICNLFNKYELTQRIEAKSEGDTSYSIVLNIPGNDRIFLHNSGTNDMFTSDDVDYESAKDSRIFHFGYPTLMKTLYENPDQLTEIFKRVKQNDTIVSLDMALPDPDAEAAKQDWMSILSQSVRYVDVFLPSFEELLLILNRKRYDELIKKSGGHDIISVMELDDLTALSDMLLEMGIGILVIKCGIKGYYVRTAGKQRISEIKELKDCVDDWSDREFICQAVDTKHIVSTNGAGDSSISGFLCGMLHHETPENCTKGAVCVADACLGTVDASSGIPDYSVILKKLKSDYAEVEYMNDSYAQKQNGVWLLKKDKNYVL